MSAVQPIEGADILYVYDDTPAKEIGLSMGAVITSINDTEIKNIDNFRDAIDNTMPNQTVNITYVFNGDIVNKQVKFISLYDFYNGITDEEINESFKNISFLGIGFNAYSGGYIQSLKNPITYDFPNGFIRLYALPIVGYIDGYNPIASPFTDSYKITGPFSAIPSNVFWMITTALYWIFWLNLLVGLFNVLPMVPLDGGFLFNDALRSFVKKVKKDISDEMRDKIVKNVSLVISLAILFLVIFPFFIKYL
jgi:membrane-associated protease RseP (regulator of RpoE activity)